MNAGRTGSSETVYFELTDLRLHKRDFRFGSNSEELSTSICFPLCPRTRTLLDAGGTSHLCQKRKCRRFQVMSALPHKADIDARDCDVRFVPLTEVRYASISPVRISLNFLFDSFVCCCQDDGWQL